MKTLLLFAIALFAAISINAQGNVQKDVEAIKKMETEINAGFAKNNADAFNKYVIQTARITTPGGERASRDQISMMLGNGGLKFTSSVITELHVLVFVDTAIATYDSDDKGTMNGMDISGKTRWTDTWARVGGNWTCVAVTGTPVMDMSKMPMPMPAPKPKQ